MPVSYTMGCCVACRAPFLPKTDYFYEEACQAVFYLQNRFPLVSRNTSPSQFTGPINEGHLITVAHMSHGMAFSQKLPPDDIDRDARCTGKGSSKSRSRSDPGTNAVENLKPSDRQEVEEAAAEAAATAVAAGEPPDMAAKKAAQAALRKTSEIVGQAEKYSGTWGVPEALQHERLGRWMAQEDLRPIELDYDLTLEQCTLCNAIYDTFARLERVLTDPSIIPSGAITATSAGTKARQSVTKSIPVQQDRDFHRRVLGLFIGYYMHRSVRYLKTKLDADKLNRLRPLAALLTFLPLHLTCMYLELKEGLATESKSEKRKGAHNYLGNMDLIISHYMHGCARAQLVNAPDLTLFGVFYLRELVECPAPVWDARHRHLCDFVFENAPTTNRKDLVAHVSDRLCELWQTKVVYLARLANGDDPGHLDPEWTRTARAYFVTKDELEPNLLSTLDTGAAQDNISYFIEHTGIAATLWQIRRYLRSETPRLGALLDEWLRAYLLREWTNIMDNSHYGIDMLQAQHVYAMQNVLHAERIVGAGGRLGSGLEISLLRAVDADTVEALLAEAGRCSVFKAAVRLRVWSFNIVSPPLLYERLEARAGLPWQGALPGPPRTTRLLAAPPRQDQPHRTSLSTWASLSERLMAARSASTARSGSSAGVCQGASPLVARRRGCGGSG
jgi:hypothetical protein